MTGKAKKLRSLQLRTIVQLDMFQRRCYSCFMRTISTYSLRDNLADYLSEVEKTEVSLVVSRFGKPIAIISPIKEDLSLLNKSYFGFLGKGLKGEKFLDKVRRSDKEKRLVTKLRAR